MWSIFLTLAFSIDHNPIYIQIIKNQPSISKEKAVKLAKLIQSNSKKYNLNPHTFAAILMQESSYRLNAKNCTVGLDKSNVKRRVCTDFGIGQIYYKTAEAYDMDVVRLTTDLEYSVEAAAIVLSDFAKRYRHKEPTYWTRYNTSKPSLRQVYMDRVQRWR